MLSPWLTIYDIELRLSELFTSYETELETHGHVQIGNQLGFVGYDVSIIGYGITVWCVSMVWR